MKNEALRRVAAAWEKVTQRVWSLALSIRPRVSLVTGSVLVLLTLFLPIAYEACGPNRTGYEFIRGKGIWPGLLSFVFAWAERGFYILTLGLAAFTILLILFSWGRPAAVRNLPLTTGLYAIAGTFSLFVIADFFWVYAGIWMTDFLERLTGAEDVMLAVAAGASLLVLAFCLRSRFLRGQRWLVWLFALAGAGSLLFLANFFLSQLSPYSLLDENTGPPLIAAQAVLYWLVPAVLWHRFGLSRREERRARWPRIRSRILLMFIPVLAIDCLLFVDVVERGIWGFLPFFAGLQLLSLGYMQLARAAESPPGNETAASLFA